MENDNKLYLWFEANDTSCFGIVVGSWIIASEIDELKTKIKVDLINMEYDEEQVNRHLNNIFTSDSIKEINKKFHMMTLDLKRKELEVRFTLFDDIYQVKTVVEGHGSYFNLDDVEGSLESDFSI